MVASDAEASDAGWRGGWDSAGDVLSSPSVSMLGRMTSPSKLGDGRHSGESGSSLIAGDGE